MTLKTDIQAAADAARTAFKTALDTDGYDESTLSELWRHYLGLKRINNDTPADPYKEYTFTTAPEESNYNFNLNSDFINYPVNETGSVAADTISFGAGASSNWWSGGADVISFGDYTES